MQHAHTTLFLSKDGHVQVQQVMFIFPTIAGSGGKPSPAVPLTEVQWNPSNPDTLGTIPSVLFSEVS